MAGHADFAGTACRVGGREHLAAQQAKEAAGALGAPARPFSRAPLCESFPCTLPARQLCRARRTPTAKWPSTDFYILLPVLFFTKKAPLRIVVRNGAFGEKRFAPRCFHALLNALSSPRGALTAVFGMGTGVSPPPVARTKGIGSGRLDPGNGAVRACNIQQAQDGSLRGGFPPPSMLPARALPTGGDRGRAASRPHGLSEAVW